MGFKFTELINFYKRLYPLLNYNERKLKILLKFEFKNDLYYLKKDNKNA
jgi:hypothetical protein